MDAALQSIVQRPVDGWFPAPRTRAGIEYAWRELGRRAGLGDGSGAPSAASGSPGFPVTYARPDAVQTNRPGIIIVPARHDAFERAADTDSPAVRWVESSALGPDRRRPALDAQTPILFWGTTGEAGGTPVVERGSDGSIIFHADILAATLFMLTRWEERALPLRDAHDRFPAMASFAYRNGFLDRPIVDEYALLLRAWVRVLLPRWRAERRAFSVKLTHDIDHLRRYPTVANSVRAIAHHTLRQPHLRHVAQAASGTLAESAMRYHAPYVRAIRSLASLATRHGFPHAAFYFMTTGPNGKGDPHPADYEASSGLTKRIIAWLQERQCEVGFHPGYATLDSFDRFAEEKARLDALLGGVRYGGRQHYLRFRVPETWRFWEQAGLSYDSTMGYADHEGFRCGTCHAFRPFDVEQNRELDLIERPLVVQDVTLRGYRRMRPDAAVDRALELARRCRAIEGTFTLLWHNSSLHYEWHQWASAYPDILSGLRDLS